MSPELDSQAPPDPAPRRRVVIAEDEPVSRHRLDAVLRKLGYDPMVCEDGEQAWGALTSGVAQLVVTDWLMPNLSGLDLCRRIRAAEAGTSGYCYVILLTGNEQGLVEGMEAGADDFITKPFRPEELRARLLAGERVLRLKEDLGRRVDELQAALTRVRRLEGLLPICSYCKNIRSEGNWEKVEEYVTRRAEVSFSHSICPSCYTTHIEPELSALEDEARRQSG